jgi:hypothetical protein
MTRPLTFAGADVRPIWRRTDGRAVIVFLDRSGEPTKVKTTAWPHELRGVGWHLAAIKKAIAALPLEGEANAVRAAEPAAPRGFLHAHHSFKED